MKKKFVAKQVGVLSLTAVLAGMPAVNVLAEDVYAQKVESLQKEMLGQTAATETKLNITFETVHGEEVGKTVAKTTATGTGDWTFMLGTDYQLPEGYQLATGVEQVTDVAVAFGATAGHTVVVEPVAGEATETKLNITFETVHGEEVGKTVAKTTATGTGDWTFMLGTDYQLPEGYQLATGVEQVTDVAVAFGATAGHTVVVEPVAGEATETKLNITFETIHGEEVGKTVAKTTATGTGDWTFMLGTDYQLPEGYQLATGVEQVTDVAVAFGATAGHTVVVEPVAGEATETKLNITFETVHGEKVGETVAKTTATGTGDWTFMLGTDYQLPEGYQLATGVEQVTDVAVAFGATGGHTVVVEPVQEAVRPTVLTVTFETVYGEEVGETVAKTTATGTGNWTFMLGTDYQLPEGYQLATGVEQVTNVEMAFGTVGGHTVVVEPVAGEVTETKLNVTFETVHGEEVGKTVASTTATGTGDWTFMLGADYQLPEGYQLATGVEQVTNVAVPFGATGGHTVVVEPVAGEVTETKLNVTFETVHGEEVGKTVASTTATGTGDWTFMLGADYQLPEGYQLATGVEQVTNVAVPFGATGGHTVVVEPVAGEVTETKLNVTFETVHGEEVGKTVASTTATGTGDWTFMLGADYQLPEGYQLATGVEQVTNVAVPFGATGGHTVVVEPVAGEVTETKLNVTFETVHGEEVGKTVASTTATGTGDWTFMLGTDYQLPEGYQLATGVEQVINVAVPFGATGGHTVVVEPVQEDVRPTVVTVTFETVHGEKVGETVAKTTATGTGDWTFMLGTDYQLPEGYQLATGVEQVTDIQVPFGATAGHTVVVEPVAGEVVETKLNVTFETVYGEKVGEAEAKTTATGAAGEAWTFMLGTDYQLPEGYQLATGVEQVTDIQVPFGATAGHTVVVEPVAGEVVETKLNVTFETVYGEKVGEAEAKTTATGAAGEAWTFMLGTDYQLPEGYQLATGVEQVTDIQVPFGATAGHTVVVEPVAGEVVETKLNVTFETVYGEKVGEAEAKTTATGAVGEAWTFMLGTDFNLPEGYRLATGVDQVTNIQVPFGATAGHTMIVEKDMETPNKPDPENPEKPNPENPEKPNPENPNKPSKPDQEKPNQDNTNKDDGKTQNTDKKTEDKSKTPKTGDDLQAAGTFSILGAGALAAIVALLKKRK